MLSQAKTTDPDFGVRLCIADHRDVRVSLETPVEFYQGQRRDTGLMRVSYVEALSDAWCLPVAGNGAWQRALRLLASETESGWGEL